MPGRNINKTKKIIILAPYPAGEVASQRFRFEQYLPYLEKAGHTCSQKSFYTRKTWRILYLEGHTFSKILGIITGYIKRIYHLFLTLNYDYVFIHREITPAGPPIFEYFIARIFCKNVVYDFDDAIWLPNTTDTNRSIAGLKWHKKVGSICQWSSKVSCGNEFLKEYADQFNSKTYIIPTTIDTANYHNKIKNQKSNRIVIGWTGTHSTLKYLNTIVPVLKKATDTLDFDILIICDKDPNLINLDYRFVKWNKRSEIDDLMEINIGIMPLIDDEWSKGKCGFKALQFMSLGIPVLVSPVGVNSKIVDHGQSGYHCRTDKDWLSIAQILITNPSLRKQIGAAGRKKVENQYSTLSNLPRFLALFA